MYTINDNNVENDDATNSNQQQIIKIITIVLIVIRLAALHDAARSGDLERAAELLRQGAAVDAKDDDWGSTPLHYAASVGHLEVAALLLEKGAAVDEKTDWGSTRGSTPLHYAASKGHLELAALLLEKGAAVDAKDDRGSTPLHQAASYGHLEVAALLLEKGAAGESPLHRAAALGQREVAAVLLEQGADVNERFDDGGHAPLHWAAAGGHREVAALLVEKGARVDEKDDLGSTPLHYAAKYSHLEVAALLLEKGAAVDVKSIAAWTYGATPLHSAAGGGHLEVAALLLEKGAAVDAKDDRGFTPLHNAAHYGHLEVAALLLEKGADAEEKDYEGGKTALHLAVERCVVEHVEQGLADMRNGTSMVVLLAQRGAWALQPDAAGLAPIDVAIIGGAPECAPAAPSSAEIWARQLTSGKFWLMMLAVAIATSAACISPTILDSVRSRCGTLTWLTPSSQSSSGTAGAQLLASEAKIPALRRGFARVFRFSEALVNCIVPMMAMVYVQPAVWLSFLAAIYVLPHLVVRRLAVLREPYIFAASAVNSLLVSGTWTPGTRGAFLLACHRILVIPLASVSAILSGFWNPVWGSIAQKWHPTSIEAEFLIYWRRIYGEDFDYTIWSICWPSKPGFSMGMVWMILWNGSILMGMIHLCLGALYACSCLCSKARHQGDATAAVSLAHDLARAENKEQMLRLGVSPVKKFKFCPPGGVYIDVAFVVADVFLDLYAIAAFITSDHLFFAGVLLTVFSTSLIAMVRSGELRRFPREARETLRMGMRTQAYQEFLDRERGVEAPFSLLVSTYALYFVYHTPGQALLGLLSLATSAWSLSTFLHERLDLQGVTDMGGQGAEGPPTSPAPQLIGQPAVAQQREVPQPEEPPAPTASELVGQPVSATSPSPCPSPPSLSLGPKGNPNLVSL